MPLYIAQKVSKICQFFLISSDDGPLRLVANNSIKIESCILVLDALYLKFILLMNFKNNVIYCTKIDMIKDDRPVHHLNDLALVNKTNLVYNFS